MREAPQLQLINRNEDRFKQRPSVIEEINKNDGNNVTALFSSYSHIMRQVIKNFLTMEVLETMNQRSGRFVRFLPEYSHIPILIGSDGEPILLSRVVEEIETILDPQEIRDAFPTLSYTQIVGSLAFLRRVAQFNTKGLDLDELDDDAMEKSEAFQHALTESLADRQMRRVHPTK